MGEYEKAEDVAEVRDSEKHIDEELRESQGSEASSSQETRRSKSKEVTEDMRARESRENGRVSSSQSRSRNSRLIEKINQITREVLDAHLQIALREKEIEISQWKETLWRKEHRIVCKKQMVNAAVENCEDVEAEETADVATGRNCEKAEEVAAVKEWEAVGEYGEAEEAADVAVVDYCEEAEEVAAVGKFEDVGDYEKAEEAADFAAVDYCEEVEEVAAVEKFKPVGDFEEAEEAAEVRLWTTVRMLKKLQL